MHSRLTARRAAQYLRMSTEHQQYSTINQCAAISQYAAENQIEIVATYEDSGRSGLTLAGRPALRRLLSDVTAGRKEFDTILVYDVSRWGRFQDADESAHLEYLCRVSGVRLVYCAESFPNDGTPFASICKVVKRALAAEYSRELSEKVFRGKKRLIELGFRQGGSAGIGLRRCLISSDGVPKGILGKGERKSLATDRIILTPGPSHEVRLVRWIYRSYVYSDMGCVAIANALNRKGILSESGRAWTRAVVKRVLTSAKYVGDNVWARTSYTLKVSRRQTPSASWVRATDVFQGIISRELFDAAQQKRLERSRTLSDSEIIRRLKHIYRTHGRITARLVNQSGHVGAACIRRRFGSLVIAAERAGYHPTRDLSFLKSNAQAQAVRSFAAKELQNIFEQNGQNFDRMSGAARFLVNKEMCLTVSIVQQRRCQSGVPRWLVKPPESACDLRVALLLNEQVKLDSMYVFPSEDIRKECLLYRRNPADLEVLRFTDLQQLVDACGREPLDTKYRLGLPLPRSHLGISQLGPGPRIPRTVRLRRMRCRTYVGAFKRASRSLREMIEREKSISARLQFQRHIVAECFADRRFLGVLQCHQVSNVPRALRFREPQILEQEERRYRDELRLAAQALETGAVLPPRVMKLLRKLRPKWRSEAIQLMLLTNDRSEEFVRSLIGATEAKGLYQQSRKRIYGADLRMLASLVRERDRLMRDAIPAISHLGRDSLDLVIVESFVRRLMAMSDVFAWLRTHHAQLFKALSPQGQ